MKAAPAALLAFSLVLPARAAELPNDAAIQSMFGHAFQALGQPEGVRPALPAPPPPAAGKPVPGPDDETQLPAEEQQTNFKYGDISNRLKKLIIGRGKARKKQQQAVWPKVADRVDKGEIKYIVVHSAMGACSGAIDQMETHHAAAHFMVCKDGSVTRLVDIKNITLHVKNEEVNAASVGIETETGQTIYQTVMVKKKKIRKEISEFTPEDWDPASRWRMYASLAWLIRAVAEEAHVTRDWTGTASAIAPGIIGHLEADRGIPDAHTDPGPLFYSYVYPDFETRFPGRGMTAEKFLMLLVKADQPPKITKLVTKAGTVLRVADVANAGVAKVILYRAAAAGSKPMQTWAAPANGLPPATVELAAPSEIGSYRVEAVDLVGNRTAAIFKVEAPPAVDTGEVKTMELAPVPVSSDSAQ